MEKTIDLELMRDGKVWIYKNKIIVTDPPGCQRTDAVLPLCHENRFFVEHMRVPAGGRVLDLCSGSGILGIFAAERASKVIGTDINPRAIEFAEFNGELNEVTHKTEWRLGNLFAPVAGMRFDAILANPPFEPNPDGVSNYLYADGGKQGTDIVCKIIEKVPEYLNTCGSFQMITWLPGESFYLLDGLRAFFGPERVVIKSIFEFSFDSYWTYRMPSTAGRVLTPFENDQMLHYVFIQVVPTSESSSVVRGGIQH